MSSNKILVYIVLFVAAIGGYGWWWQDRAESFSQGYERLSHELFPDGTQINYTLEDTGGFPFRIYFKLSGFSVDVPDYGQIIFETVELIHQPWTLGHTMFHFEGPVLRIDADGATMWSMTATKNLASLVGQGNGRLSFDLDMRGIQLATASDVMDIAELQYHAITSGYFGDDTTEAVTVTKTEGLPPLF